MQSLIQTPHFSVSRARLLCTWRPPPSCLCGFLWRTEAGHWGPFLDHPSSISDTTGWQSTYSHSLMNIQFTPASFKGKKERAYLYGGDRKMPSLSLLPLPLPQSLHIYNLQISSNMQALISCACFIRVVDQETPPPPPQHFEEANTILHRWRERKIPFVLCQHKHFNLRLSLLSKQQIFSEAQRDRGNTCGSFNLTLISRGTARSAWPPCFCQSARACISQEERRGVRVRQRINSRQDQQSHFCSKVL